MPEGVADLGAFKRLMYRLGWNVESLPAGNQELGALVEEALDTLNAIEASPAEADISTALRRIPEGARHLSRHCGSQRSARGCRRKHLPARDNRASL